MLLALYEERPETLETSYSGQAVCSGTPSRELYPDPNANRASVKQVWYLPKRDWQMQAQRQVKGRSWHGLFLTVKCIPQKENREINSDVFTQQLE